MAEVYFLSKRTVASTKVVQLGKFCSLSVLDRIMEPCNLRIVFYYRFPAKYEVGIVTKKLGDSLSETLSNFEIVTGRLQRSREGQWMIKCNDAGVRMAEARAKGSVEEWLQTVDNEKELKLIYWEDMFHKPYYWSTFYVQVTEFEGGGLAIGLSCTHLLADAECATMLIKAWADTTLTGNMLTPPLYHPLPPRRIGNNHKPYTELISHYKSTLEKINPISTSPTYNYATVTLAFNDNMAQSTGALDNSSPSPFAALAGLFWVCISKVKGKREGLVNMTVCLDMRKELGLDKGFFGNCMVFNKVCGEGLKEIGVVKAASVISDVVGKMSNEGNILDLIEWLESKSNKDGNDKSHRSPPPPINGPDLVFANWEKLDPYSATFEEGVEPIRVSYYLEPLYGEGQVLILASPKDEDDEGCLSRVAMVTLPQDQAVKLCEDALIRRFSPTILMGVKKNYA
ncbi:hypothetical protein HHK36_014018 [Tetracentron sinense]|uniref:Uncharacterized protein n=1 Tax=Tetracentron sinense TaxID=13715 RepID=A0A834Z945_TETSI|nr:hypothetical protein HHK36_014018 [Tetracentron sinense]